MATDYSDYFGTNSPMEISNICEGGMDPLNPFAAEMQEEEKQRQLEMARVFLMAIQEAFPDNAEIREEADYLIHSDWPFLCLGQDPLRPWKRETLNKAISDKDATLVLKILTAHANFLRDLPF